MYYIYNIMSITIYHYVVGQRRSHFYVDEMIKK